MLSACKTRKTVNYAMVIQERPIICYWTDYGNFPGSTCDYVIDILK